MVASYVVTGGRIQAPKCEVNVVEHCNLACRSCSHLSPVLPKSAVDPASLHRDLALLARAYHAQWARLLGGEPLLHTDLLAVAEAVRRSGVAERICLVTNGVLLPRMSMALWHELDRVEVSMYPGRELSAVERRTCKRRARAARTQLAVRRCREFRVSYTEAGTADRALVKQIYESCLVAHDWRCHTVAHGRFYKCPQSYLLPKLLDGCAGHQSLDSIRIDGGENFRQDLLAYLESSEPLATCGYCLGTAGQRFPHIQVRRADFRGLQDRRGEELVDPKYLKSAPRR